MATRPGASVIDAKADTAWPGVPETFRNGAAHLPPPWDDIFGPLQRGTVDDLVVVGQIGQSLDGRSATSSGHSKYINGPAGLNHLHRLRALVDAVVVGIGTALADDPQLTVRRVAGPHPARVVIDPRGRIPAQARLFEDNGARRLVITAEGVRCALPQGVETIALPAANGGIAPAAIVAALAARGFRRLLIEGGAQTVSRFLAAGCLDRLHVVVAPMLLGSGRPSLELAPIDRADQALRPGAKPYPLGDEVLFDCDLSPLRKRIGFLEGNISQLAPM
jgi:diaminohydroxyphosphoribosylaminopyrimidine deaminase/5-amino-6-(5-phosphoribosylamino)uracil reductase